MNQMEMMKIVSAIKTYFPRENLFPNRESIELWYEELKDFEYPVLVAALKKHVDTNNFPPTIAELRKNSSDLMHGEIADWSEAWGKVIKAIHKYGTYREHEALESLDEHTRTAVKRMDWQSICQSEKVEVERAQFKTIYEQVANKAEKTRNVVPMISELTQKFLKGIDD